MIGGIGDKIKVTKIPKIIVSMVSFIFRVVGSFGVYGIYLELVVMWILMDDDYSKS
ncbi:hypothetical protein H4219_004694, partial [Mycoemilia scoparia]